MAEARRLPGAGDGGSWRSIVARSGRGGHRAVRQLRVRAAADRRPDVRPRGDDALYHPGIHQAPRDRGSPLSVPRAQHAVCRRFLWPLPIRAGIRLHGRPRVPLRPDPVILQRPRGVTTMADTRHKPRLGVFKFASCDGCQLSLLDCEDELLAVAGAVEIAYFLEATRRPLEGNFDLSLVEGSISSPE